VSGPSGLDRRVDLIDEPPALAELEVLGEIALGRLARLAIERHVQGDQARAVHVAVLNLLWLARGARLLWRAARLLWRGGPGLLRRRGGLRGTLRSLGGPARRVGLGRGRRRCYD